VQAGTDSPAEVRPGRLDRRQWLLVALTGLGVLAVSASYYLLNGPPPAARWPAFYAWDPRTGALVGPGGASTDFHAFVLKSWLDAKIPYIPALVIPYLSFLVLVPVAIPLALLRIGRLRQFYTYGTALITSQLVLDLGYFLFPTTVLREPEAASRFDWLVDLVRSGDQPFNGFPSGHTAWTTIAIIALWRSRATLRRTAAVLIPWLLLVYPATVALRQHYLIDVYAGIFVGLSCYWVCLFLVERPALVASG
jgi:membrane-associated phospholipid phosphatase